MYSVEMLCTVCTYIYRCLFFFFWDVISMKEESWSFDDQMFSDALSLRNTASLSFLFTLNHRMCYSNHWIPRSQYASFAWFFGVSFINLTTIHEWYEQSSVHETTSAALCITNDAAFTAVGIVTSEKKELAVIKF